VTSRRAVAEKLRGRTLSLTGPIAMIVMRGAQSYRRRVHITS
jgi:hypothetical protein